jgi:hypothetical protein
MHRPTLELMRQLAKETEELSAVLMAGSRGCRDSLSLLRDALEMAATIFDSVAWAVGAAADRNDITPLAELADRNSEWLLEQRVGIPGQTFADLVRPPATVDAPPPATA